MASKSLVFVSILIAAMAATHMTPVQGTLIGFLRIIRIQGALFCTANGNANVNVTASPPFPNAQVQLRCSGIVIANTITNTFGVFSIVLNPFTIGLPSLLANCRLVVTTPLTACNATLSAPGTLTSGLLSAGSTNLGVLTVDNVIPTPFQVQASV